MHCFSFSAQFPGVPVETYFKTLDISQTNLRCWTTPTSNLDSDPEPERHAGELLLCIQLPMCVCVCVNVLCKKKKNQNLPKTYRGVRAYNVRVGVTLPEGFFTRRSRGCGRWSGIFTSVSGSVFQFFRFIHPRQHYDNFLRSHLHPLPLSWFFFVEKVVSVCCGAQTHATHIVSALLL